MPVVLDPESQNIKDKSVQCHGHLSGQSLQGTSGEHTRSTSFSRPGGAEEGEDPESGEGLLLETNPAYQSGTFIADTNGNNNDTHEPSSAFSMGVRDSGYSGNDEIGAVLTAVQEMDVGAPQPNDEADARVSGVNESTVDIDANDIYDVVL